MENVFDNLWRFDDNLNIVPDAATQVPTRANGGISQDGLTYTVHLNPNAKFSNGDPVDAQTVLYSWSRAADLQGAFAANLSAVAGYGDAQKATGSPPAPSSAGATATFRANIDSQLAAGNGSLFLSGLTAPDGPAGHTVQIMLAFPCGWCLTAWTLEASPASLVDPNVIKSDPINWWRKPSDLVGSGPYKLSSYVPKQSIAFTQVHNWWGSPKPTLTKVDIEIHGRSAVATDVISFERGTFDLIGYGGANTSLPLATILAIKDSSAYGRDLHTQPIGRTQWVSFNIGYPATGGPFVGDAAPAKGLRLAFTLAVDKQRLATTVCHDLTCQAATGGVITKSLIGYGGDHTDPLAAFDPGKAKQLLREYDPNGTKTANLKYSYDPLGLNGSIAMYLQSQWQANLGVHVTLDPHPDSSEYLFDRLSGKFVLSQDTWQFDYDHPQDWYDNLWGYRATAVGGNTTGFDDPTYDSILKQADREPLGQALPLYNHLAKILQDDVVYLPLYYSVGTYLIQPYVKGAGSNTASDYHWNEIQILTH